MSVDPSLLKRLAAAKEVALLVGALIMEDPVDRIRVSFKGKSDVVTQMDVMSEHYIKDFLNARFPYDDFVGEELGLESHGGCGRWIIDPIDGTSNYVHSIPGFTISIAYEVEPFKPVIGVVYSPSHKELYYAMKGEGAYCNGSRISVSNISQPKEALTIICPPLRKLQLLPLFQKIFWGICQETGDTRDFGSAALHWCYLASGKADGFFEFGLKYHDVAAGMVLLGEAGGKYSDLYLEDQESDMFSGNMIASNTELHLWYTSTIRSFSKSRHEKMDNKQIFL